MNQRDADLLEKQLAYLRPAPARGNFHFAVTVAIFIAGIGAGSLLVLRDPNATLTSSARAPQTLLAAYSAPRADGDTSRN